MKKNGTELDTRKEGPVNTLACVRPVARSIASAPRHERSSTTAPPFPRTRKAQELSTAKPIPPRAHSHLQIPRPPPQFVTNPTCLRKPPCQVPSNQPPTPPRNQPHLPTAGGQDGASKQHHDRHPERGDVPPLGAHLSGRHLAARARRRHGVRAVPGGAIHRGGGRPHARLHRGPRRRMLPRHLPPLVLPRRHVRPHRRPPRLHRLRLRRHQQGRRRRRLRPRREGVQARGLLQLAPEEGREQQELEQDQGVPRRRQGLQVARGQAGDLQPVLTQRFLTHPVWLLQASEQLRLQLLQRHVERHRQLDVGPGLHRLEQRRVDALLRLQLVQGRRGGHAEAGLEAHRHPQHHLPRLHRHRLLGRLLRLQEQPPGPPQRWVQAERVRLIGRSLSASSPLTGCNGRHRASFFDAIMSLSYICRLA